MKKIMLLFIALIYLGKSADAQTGSIGIRYIEDNEYTLKYQAFASHDDSGTHYDTVSNKGDFVVFCRNGHAYMKYKGVLDSLRYYYIDSTSICFGDTPFDVSFSNNGNVVLYQHEHDNDGNYNDVTYLLVDRRKQKIEPQKH